MALAATFIDTTPQRVKALLHALVVNGWLWGTIANTLSPRQQLLAEIRGGNRD
jgi:hypothetical protein